MKTKIIWNMILLLSAVLCYSESNDYRALVKESLLKYRAGLTQDSGQKINYEMKIFGIDNTPPIITNFTMIYNSRRMKLENNKLIVMMDSALTCYISKDEKEILLHKNTTSNANKNDLINIMKQMNELLDKTELISSETIDGTIKFILKFDQTVPKQVSNSKITYLINELDKTLKSIIISYGNKESKIQTQEINFISQSILVNDNFFKNSIESNIMNGNGELLSEFRDFQLVRY